MKMIRKSALNILTVIFLLFLLSCHADHLFIDSADEHIEYTGRINFENASAPVIYWSGSSIEIRVTGGSVKAMLEDERGENYFNIIIDDKYQKYIRLDTLAHWYTLASNLPDGDHTVGLVKRNEWNTGSTTFYGFEVSDGSVLEQPAGNGRIIEFFGNSITAGYAIENDTGNDSPDSIYTNNYATYGAITARHFNADYYGTVRSGIGIMVSWFPLIMPEMYNRLDPTDPESTWDFSLVQPDIVVVNLFQNDSWLVNMPEHDMFKLRFGTDRPDEAKIINSYKKFVSGLRDVYPDAHIICALGSMDATREDSPWPRYVKSAVEQLDDDKIYTLFFPFIGKGGHPRVEDNKVMAKKLIGFIEENIDW
jgi:hypothetical protein